MSFVSGLLGGSTGAGFQGVAPGQAGIDAANNLISGTNGSIAQQQAFVNALAGQNGLANQSSVFGQQQATAGQLQGIANGQGPNPAMAALNQATGQNVAAQSAMMAGQRGSSANAGLIARQAAQQGAATQQQAVGQGATMQAQQSLAALQQLQNQQAQMAALSNTQVNQQQTGIQALNQSSLQNQSNLMGLQSSANSANAGVANTNAGGQANILGGVMGAVGSAMQYLADGGEATQSGQTQPFMLPGSQTLSDQATNAPGWSSTQQPPSSKFSMPSQQVNPSLTPTSNNQIAPAATPSQQGATPQSAPQSKAAQSMGSDKSSPPPLAQGANQMASSLINATEDVGKYIWNGLGDVWSGISDFASGIGGDIGTMAGGAADAVSSGAVTEGIGDVGTAAVMVAAKGGEVPALVSPGERRIKKQDVKKFAEGKMAYDQTEKIPGKPKVGGAKNSYANDTVPKTLKEGDIILPRSVTQHPHPQWAAHKFVSDIMAQKHRKKSK